MPAFSAINLEPEESIDEEVDNTKQLQVDDALKLFQAALKLHAQGPQFYPEAAQAYDTLFGSEIFKYPEASTDYDRAERQPDPLLSLEPSSAVDIGAEVAEVADADGSGSSLPQAFYLAYKNHGQFLLDRARNTLRTRGATPASSAASTNDEYLPVLVENGRGAISDFNAALDRDPSDAELWRRTARVAAFLGSTRISRYCLESSIELDDDPAVAGDVEPPSLAEAFAGEQLRAQLDLLADEIALSHPIMGPFLKHEIAASLRRYMDPLPWLPDPTRDLKSGKPFPDAKNSKKAFIFADAPSWAALGLELVRFVNERGFPGDAIVIQIPGLPEEDEDDVLQMEIDKQLRTSEAGIGFSGDHRVESPKEIAAEKDKVTGKDKEQEGGADSAARSDSAPKGKDSAEERGSSLSRKRSQSTAGLAEAADEEHGDTKRSKRTRRRDTAAEEAVDPNTMYATQLQPLQAADQNLFQMTKNILENLSVSDPVVFQRILEVLDSCASEERSSRLSNQAAKDLRDAITSFDDQRAKILLSKKDAPALGLNAFLEHTKTGPQRTLETPAFDETQGLSAFVRKVNATGLTIHDVTYEWLMALLKSYVDLRWTDAMKMAVVQVISWDDEGIYRRVLYELQRQTAAAQDRQDAAGDVDDLVQMLFELHLDVYERITNPNSAVDYKVRVETKGRLGRWMDLASELARSPRRDLGNRLTLRFLWASVFFATLAEGVSRDHILACWDSLRQFLDEFDGISLSLPNNAVMPEISQKAADREISKLTTMDFFLGLFQQELGDPVTVIETLEPVLNPESVCVPCGPPDADRNCSSGPVVGSGKQKVTKKPILEVANQGLRDLWKFLRGSSTDLRLFLWTRLGDAYKAIGYSTKVFSCHLRSIEMIAADLDSEAYLETPQETRRVLFLQTLKSLDDLIISALSLALNDNSAFDIMDEEHVRATSAALVKLNCVLHVAAMYEDEIRIGMTAAPATGATFQSFLNKLREMQVRFWSLLYTVLKVGISQHRSSFISPQSDLAGYLAAVHQVLGLRKYCKSSNKIFLRMSRVELLRQVDIENWEDYLGQVLYDLHGLRLGVGIGDIQEHGCPAEKLERKNAVALIDKVTVLVNRMSMKDLLKSDLKTTIEHMQQAIGQTKSTTQMIHNLRNFTEYLKKPIHPLRLYQAWRGAVSLDAVTANTPDNVLAQNGWFFLMGMIALTKFKGVELNRRQTPGATDDLRVGAQYLRLQLQLTPDRWDAWFRLGECFDYDLDEDVLWTSEKMNKDRAELVKLQRNAIHCYTLALSYSSLVSTQLLESESEALYELYHSFGMRMYASSREPFAMEAFHHPEHERWFIESKGMGTFKRILHGEMSDYKVWKYAAGLFRKAMVGRPKDWKNPYMLAKCIWKMYQKPVDELESNDKASRPTREDVVKALEKTIEIVSLLPKPRHGQDPVLEPHYKMVSVMHKLVTRGDITAQEGADILQRQPYAIQHGEEVKIEDAEDWKGFVIKSLRHLRDKDKSNWQHRIIIRHARILFDFDESSDSADAESVDNPRYPQAKAAFLVLRESMVTKTMVMNVWKCDAERPGRHHVYMEQYVRFLTRLLLVMNDRSNMEALLRRIRRKGIEFYHFNDMWQTCVASYTRILRQTYSVPPMEEDVFKNLAPEEFEILSERITEWVGQPGVEHRALSAMRDAIELKKLNGNLVKAGPIDDLIHDCYAVIYTEVSHELPGEDPTKIIEERQQRLKDDMERATESVAAGPSKPGNDSGANLLSGLLALGDRDNLSRAGSEAPEKMDKQGSSMGEHHVRRGRVAGVRRADIMRKAEQAILRLAELPPKSAVSAGPRGEGRKSRHSSASSGQNENAPGGEADQQNSNDKDNGSDNGGEEDRDGDVEMKDREEEGEEEEEEEEEQEEEQEQEQEEENADPAADTTAEVVNEGDDQQREQSEASSPPGSLHDSADDESDLSDVPPDYEDNAPPSLLFPNLRRSVDTGTPAERGGSGGSSSGDETEEAEDAEDAEEAEEGDDESEGQEDGSDEDASSPAAASGSAA